MDGCTDLAVISGSVNITHYTNIIPRNYVVPVASHVGPGFMPMHHNKCPHIAHATQNFLQGHNIQVMEWSVMSLDLNPIEHVWYMLQRWIHLHLTAPEIFQQLSKALVEEWGLNTPE